MFAKHLPPSAHLPRVLALNDVGDLPAEIALTRGGAETAGEFDAVVGDASPAQLPGLLQRLRPGGRVILTQRAEPQALLEALSAAGFIHCLVEPVGEVVLYRGERPPLGASVERLQTLDANPNSPTPFLFLLITQTPNKPAWKLGPGDRLAWRATTVLDAATERPVVLAFSSLVKAVAFMQSAVLSQWVSGINKVGKFRAAVAHTWALPVTLNPDFETVRAHPLGPLYAVDPQTAMTGEE